MVDIYLCPVPAFANPADIMLVDPAVGCATTATWDDKRPRARSLWKIREQERYAAQSLLKNLMRQYGISEGKRVYDLMRVEGKGPFKEGGKYEAESLADKETPPD